MHVCWVGLWPLRHFHVNLVGFIRTEKNITMYRMALKANQVHEALKTMGSPSLPYYPPSLIWLIELFTLALLSVEGENLAVGGLVCGGGPINGNHVERKTLAG